MKRFHSYILGLRDGYIQKSLTSGITWDDQARNLSYDRGANLGEALNALVEAIRGEGLTLNGDR